MRFALLISNSTTDTITPIMTSYVARTNNGFIEGQECVTAKLQALGGTFNEMVPADLFQDESINLTRQVKDFSRIETIFTDYTQSFQIPATDINNGIFANYFSENIEFPTWNPNLRLPASIEIYGMPVFYGSLEMLSVDFSNGLPQSYSVVFYGQVKNLTSTWGEKTLDEIDWSAYDHTIDNATAEASWTGGLFAGKVIWDIKDYNQGWVYSKYAINNNIYFGDGITYLDLRPSIRLKNMVEHVFNQVGYSMSGTLFSRGEFTNLYVTPMGNAGPLLDYTALQYGLFDAENITPVTINPYPTTKSTWSTLPLGVNIISNPSGSWNAGTFEYTMPINGDYAFQVDITQISALPLVVNQYNALLNGVFLDSLSGNDAGLNVWTIYVRKATKGDKFKIVYNAFKTSQISGEIRCTYSPYNVKPAVVMAEAMPKIKVTDFINSVLQTFNAVILPNGQNGFAIHNIEDWYNAGANKDYTTYIDFTKMTHKKMDIPSSISMKHKSGESQSDLFFKNTYSREYGSISFRPDVDFASAEMKIETLFNVFPPQRMNMINQSGIKISETDIDMPVILNNDGKGVQQDLLLFYFQDYKVVTYPYRWAGTTKTYQPVSMPYTNTPTTGASSVTCSFGLEASAVGDMPTQTIYMNFWNEFVSRLYSTRSRVVICSGYVPVGEWINMSLNDSIVISGNYYKIQKIDYDILTEEAKLELITYPKVNKIAVTGVTGRRPTIGYPVLNAEGKTYIDGIPLSLGITNAQIFGGVLVTDAQPMQEYNYSMNQMLDAMMGNYLRQVTISKATMWTTADYNLTISNVAQNLTYTDEGIEGQNNLYTPTIATGTITINQSGQYRVRAWAVLDTSGSHDVEFVIALNGIETEGYWRIELNHIQTANCETIVNIPDTGVISFSARSNDGGTHTMTIKKSNITIEKMF